MPASGVPGQNFNAIPQGMGIPSGWLALMQQQAKPSYGAQTFIPGATAGTGYRLGPNANAVRQQHLAGLGNMGGPGAGQVTPPPMQAGDSAPLMQAGYSAPPMRTPAMQSGMQSGGGMGMQPMLQQMMRNPQFMQMLMQMFQGGPGGLAGIGRVMPNQMY